MSGRTSRASSFSGSWSSLRGFGANTPAGTAGNFKRSKTTRKGSYKRYKSVVKLGKKITPLFNPQREVNYNYGYIETFEDGDSLYTTFGSSILGVMPMMTVNLSSTTAAAAFGGGTSASEQYTFTNIFQKWIFGNPGITTVHLDIYLCKARRDINTSDTAMDTPMELLTTGFGRRGWTATAAQPWFITPYQSTTFCEFFKIINKKTIILLPGASAPYTWHKNGFTYKRGTYVNNANNAFTVSFPKGQTMLLGRMHGYPTGTSTNGTSAAVPTTTCGGTLRGVGYTRYRGRDQIVRTTLTTVEATDASFVRQTATATNTLIPTQVPSDVADTVVKIADPTTF